MARGRVSDPLAWVVRRIDGAPAALRERVEYWLASVSAEEAAERCAAAGRAALAHSLAGSSDRSSAGDVLAADALVTLALLAVADRDPARLAAVAAELRRSATPSA
jgi:hypothetical protein